MPHARTQLSALAVTLCSLSLAANAAPPPLAAVPEGQTFSPYVYAGTRYDSNPFRFSGEAEAQRRLDTRNFDDLVNRAGAGMRMTWPISLQTLRFDGWLERNRYNRFDELDHTAGDATLAWDWEVGRRFDGTVKAGYGRRLARFEESQSVAPDIKTTRRYSVDGGYSFLPDWEVRAGVGKRDVRHDRRDVLDRRERSRFAEIAYESPTGSRVGLRAERADADLQRRGRRSNDYTQSDYGLVLDWAVSEISQLTGRLGYTRRDYDERPAREFSGPTARLIYDWQPTVKTGVRLSMWRELQSRNDDAVSYALAEGVRLQPTWQATPLVRLRASVAWETSDFQGDDDAASPNAGREDETFTYGVGLDYEIRRDLRLAVGIKREVRDSSRQVSDYDYEQVTAGVSYAF